MKKIVILSVVAFSLATSVHAQKKDNKSDSLKTEAVRKQKDSVDLAQLMPSDTTALIKPVDILQFDQQILSELPAKYVDIIRNYWSQILQYRRQEFINQKRKTPPPGK